MSVASDALHWLESRSPAPPEALLRRVAEAVRGVAECERADAPDGRAAGAEGVARRLAEAAVDRLRLVLEAPADRAAALDLLAADALLTYALEAAAEAGPDALEAVVREFGVERLSEFVSLGAR